MIIASCLFFFFLQQTVQVWTIPKTKWVKMQSPLYYCCSLVFQIMHQVGFIPNDSLSSHNWLVGSGCVSSHSYMRAPDIFWFLSGLHRKVQQMKVTENTVVIERTLSTLMLFISCDNNIELVTETRIPWNNKDLLIVFVVWTLLSVDPFLNRSTLTERWVSRSWKPNVHTIKHFSKWIL